MQLVLETMAKELKQAMILTGCKNISEIDARIIFNMENEVAEYKVRHL